MPRRRRASRLPDPLRLHTCSLDAGCLDTGGLRSRTSASALTRWLSLSLTIIKAALDAPLQVREQWLDGVGGRNFRGGFGLVKAGAEVRHLAGIGALRLWLGSRGGEWHRGGRWPGLLRGSMSTPAHMEGGG